MTRDVHCETLIQDLDFSHPESRGQKAPDPGSGTLSEANISSWYRMLEGWKLSTCIEPAVFLQTFSWGLQMVVSQDLLIAKTCRLRIMLLFGT